MNNPTVRRAARAFCALVIAFAGLGMNAAEAQASFISIESDSSNSTENLGRFTGSIEYNYQFGYLGTINITLTNTSAAANAGLLTGFVFNIDSADPDACAVLQSGTHPFFLDAQGENAAPFGDDFDAGAALGGNFLGGGSTNNGIPVVETGTFTFQLVASDAANLTAESFINGPYAFDFIVRFRGFEDGGSDKVPAMVTIVPAPAALSVLSVCILGLRNRKRV
jgi:hypothetical protein